MQTKTLVHIGACLGATFFLAHCSNAPSSADDDDSSGKGGSTSGKGGSSVGGMTKGGTSGSSGTMGGTSTLGGTGGSTGGSTMGGTGGSSAGAGQGGSTSGSGNVSGGTGGSNPAGAGGSLGGGGTGGSTGGVGNGGTGGGSAGMAGSGMAGASSCPETDMNGKANWKPGDMTSTSKDYLRSCETRLINNNWGAVELNCSGSSNQYSVFVNTDGSFGWNFNRGVCDPQASGAKPDFPEVEFGIHPFGNGSSLATTPSFSTTTLLPIQIKDIQSASVTVNNISVQLNQQTSWDMTFELWLSERNPVTDPNPGVYAEIMTFWGWQANRWPDCAMCMGPAGKGLNDVVAAGTKSYKLIVQSDNWASGWRYFQFRANDGSQNSFNGKVDVKLLLDYLTGSTHNYSKDLWVTRLEVGSEIDDSTSGKVTAQGITFEVNGQSRTVGKQ